MALGARNALSVYDIPASSPLYNVTYVRVYETEPDAVWYGYTAGYTSGFLAWDTYVYGTGWYYPPYWYDWSGYGPIYYPRPVTWGMGAYYNPVRGAYGRYGYAYGPYRGIGVGRAWNPATGTYGGPLRPGGRKDRPDSSEPTSQIDAGGYAAGGSNVYGAWKSAGVKRGDDWARVTAGAGNAGGSTVRWNTSANQGFIHEGRRGDLYAGRDGKVYRNAGNGWQKWESGWQNVDPAATQRIAPGWRSCPGSSGGRPDTHPAERSRGSGRRGRRRRRSCPATQRGRDPG